MLKKSKACLIFQVFDNRRTVYKNFVTKKKKEKNTFSNFQYLIQGEKNIQIKPGQPYARCLFTACFQASWVCGWAIDRYTGIYWWRYLQLFQLAVKKHLIGIWILIPFLLTVPVISTSKESCPKLLKSNQKNKCRNEVRKSWSSPRDSQAQGGS